jgi:ketosteroid isomerase-like protein
LTGTNPYCRELEMAARLHRMAEVRRYFDSWNARDPTGVLAAFAPGGTYTDPTGTTPLSGSALEEHVRALFFAFPDLSFEVTSARVVDSGLGGPGVVVPWLMRGTHTGPLARYFPLSSYSVLPPSGGSLALPGVDLIGVKDGKIAAVERHFDRQTMAEQLGFQVIVQPETDGMWQLGFAARATGGSTAMPGAISLTWADVRSAEEAEQIDEIGGQFGTELTEAPGFISVVTGGIGRRVFTIAAWEDEQAIRSALRNKLHAGGVKLFYTKDFLGSFGSGIFTAHRIGPVLIRCTSCVRVMEWEKTDGICKCGQPLPGPLQRW